MRRLVGFVSVALLLAACGGSASDTASTTTVAPSTSTTVPGSTASSTSTSVTVAPATTTTAVPGSTVTLLIADDAGLRRWSEDGSQEWLISGRAMKGAVPDRVGGVLYQQVETGRFAMRFSPDYGSAWYEWAGDGTPRPIRRLSADGSDEVVVAAAPSQMLWIVDSTVVEGRPHLVYLRATHVRDEGQVSQLEGWDATRTSELVIRDLTTGAESVAWSRQDGWEAGGLESKVGGGTVVDVEVPYGEGERPLLSITDVNGAAAPMPYRPTEHDPTCWVDSERPIDRWCLAGQLRADLEPDGSALAYGLIGRLDDGRAAGQLTVAVIDTVTWTERLRVSVPIAPDAMPIAVDAADGRVLVSLAAWQPLADPPTLRRGDRGEWVRLLQDRLTLDEQPLVPDGVFGSMTEAAVRQVQQQAGLAASGVVDPSTWAALMTYTDRSFWARQPLVLVEPDGSTRTISVPGTSEPTGDLALRSVTRVTLWDE